SKNLNVFYDDEELEWGDSLTEVLNRALGKSKLFLAVLSANSINKTWPRKEINVALSLRVEGKQKFLPLIVGSPNMSGLALTSDLLHITWNDNPEEIANELIAALKKFS
ncbi:toll/interleukin-1 receptor domain-containing protein, partial [Thiolapillus sp.]